MGGGVYGMAGTGLFGIKSEKLMERLAEFEEFCMGRRVLSPERFMDINKELSLGTLQYVGRHHLQRQTDGDHLIWVDNTQRPHDLGLADDLDILHQCPGFHRGRTLALAPESDILSTDIIHVALRKAHMTTVTLKDGVEGIGPDFKVALRNAVLKRQLTSQFNKARGFSFWSLFTGGNA
jgi:hypothetical protein